MSTTQELITIPTLRGGIIKVLEGCPPDMAFFALFVDPPAGWTPTGPQAQMDLAVESFARMSVLSQDLRDRIRDELQLRSKATNPEWMEYTRNFFGG